MRSLSFLETEKIGTWKAGLLVGASQEGCDPERCQAPGSGDVWGLPAQPLCCLWFYDNVSVFLLPPFPVCKKGIAPLESAEMKWRKSKSNLKIDASKKLPLS